MMTTGAGRCGGRRRASWPPLSPPSPICWTPSTPRCAHAPAISTHTHTHARTHARTHEFFMMKWDAIYADVLRWPGLHLTGAPCASHHTVRPAGIPLFAGEIQRA